MEVVIRKDIIMSMTAAQARQLGKLVASARKKARLSSRALATELGVANGWIAELENGRFVDPAPDRLARLAEVLDIEPSRIERLTKGAMAEGLPGARAYFRAKYDLSAEDVAKVERYIDRLRRAA
jgi:transcriptional regulator with XRE-family HTH domain